MLAASAMLAAPVSSVWQSRTSSKAALTFLLIFTHTPLIIYLLDAKRERELLKSKDLLYGSKWKMLAMRSRSEMNGIGAVGSSE
ncbi:hypothetical protein D3C78_1095080 [compost metagenome]